MTKEVLFYNEGTEYNKSGNDIIFRSLRSLANAITVKSDSFKFNIVGLLIVNNMPVIVFPKNHTISFDISESKSDAFFLLKTLIRYSNEGRFEPEEAEFVTGSDKIQNGRILAAINLIEDYHKNGLLRRKTNIESLNIKGHINWNATVNKTYPYNNHHRPAYLSPVMQSKVADHDNIIMLIHRYVVNESLKLWGWFLGYEADEFHDEVLPLSITEAISKLKIELGKTYIQREIYVIEKLIQYLTSKSGDNDSFKHEIFATTDFCFVWEAICGYIFQNNYSKLKSIIPKPIWVSNIVKKNVSQRPDILFIQDNELYIIDAKYYDYTNSIPGWHDIVKQMYYKHTIEQCLETEKGKQILGNVTKIYNIFVLPGEQGRDLQYLGYVSIPEVDCLGKIYAYTLDIKKTMEIYANRKVTVLKQKFLDSARSELKTQ